MSPFVRTWLGLAAVGAGLIHLAVAAGAPPLALAIFSVAGVVELAWGLAALARTSIPLPRFALAGSLVPTVVWVVLLVLGTRMHGMGLGGGMQGMGAAGTGAPTTSNIFTDIPLLPMLAGSLLDLVPAVWIAALLRLGRDPGAPDGPMPSAWRYLGGVLAGGAVVAIITSSALGGTLVGALARKGMGM